MEQNDTNLISEKATFTRTQKIVFTGMFAAVLAVLSQIALPMPSGVSITLQTFAVALCGYFLGWKLSMISVAAYIALGAVGVPVFTGFTGGIGKIVGVTGGFIWGFLPMAAACGAGRLFKSKIVGVIFGEVGLLLCHLLGIIQFSVVASTPFWQAAVLVSLPYLLKDIPLTAAAFFLAEVIKKRVQLSRAE